MEESSLSFSDIVKPYHRKQSLCYKRPKYREARWERTVKVYTINDESKYLLVQGVPSVNAKKELLQLFEAYGEIEEHRKLEDYPCEQFTEVYWIKYRKTQAARFGKRKLDNHSFFGGQLHVCYAPEYEKVQDTREKLNERRKLIRRKCQEYFGGGEKDVIVDSTSGGKREGANDFTVSVNYSQSKLCETTTQQLPQPTVENSQYSPVNIPKNKNIDILERRVSSIPGSQRRLENSNKSQNNFPESNVAEFVNKRHLAKGFSPLDKFPDYPRVPTHHATLPPEIQNLKTQEVYQSQSTGTVVRENFKTGLLTQTSQISTLSTSGSSGGEPFVKKKRIVWNTPSTGDGNHCYTKEIGAWDPYKERREYNHRQQEQQQQEMLTSANHGPTATPEQEPITHDEYDNIVSDVRKKLIKTAEPAQNVRTDNRTCPLQNVNQEFRLTDTATAASTTKRKRSDGRKRI